MVQQRVGRFSWRRHPNLVFWVCFLIANGLLFLPLYLLTPEVTELFPFMSIFANGPWLGVNRLFIWRDNLDPLRISLELVLLTALWVMVRRIRRTFVRYLFILIYLLALSYYIYEAIVLSVYLADPIFYSQYFLARDGIPFLFSHIQAALWIYLVAIAGIAVLLAAIILLLNLLLESASSPQFHRLSRIAIVVLAGLCVAATLIYQIYTARPEMVVSSMGFKLQRNIAASLKLHEDVANFDGQTVSQAYDYAGYQLEQKPDIYLIFVESYGSVLYKRPDFRLVYTSLLTELEDQLHDNGWYATSALSVSPTWGGGSWLSYTSLLSGLRIDSQPQYLSLFNKYQVDAYPNLGRYLQSQGYYYAWVSAISEQWEERTWANYVRFLGMDRMLRYRELDYHGQHYGWGPAPPDQYVLNYTNEVLQSGTDRPLFYFTITQNSHYPWEVPPEIVDDWHTLNQETPETSEPQEGETAEIDQAEKRQNYMRAIEYELRMLTDFILKNGDDHSLFILVGDHQPPQVSRRSDGFDTPVHIIAKDQALIEAFAEYAFDPGLGVDSLEPQLHHEGFYSLLMRVLQQHYGVNQVALPPYLPGGVLPGEPDATAIN